MESVVEAASHFSSINAVCREIEISIFNATERSAVKSQQAHMKKFQPKKFQCNEKVIFHNPHIHGIVIIPNQVGEIISELPGGYYEIKCDEGVNERRVRLHSSTIVPYTYPETLNLISVIPNKSLVSAETLRDEVLRFAKTQRQHHFKNKLHKNDDDVLVVNELTLNSILHVTKRMDLKNREDPDTLIDLYCYACDCFIVSNLTTNVSLKEQCKNHHKFIIHFLSKINFAYNLTALYSWQLSRTHNILPLLYAIQSSDNPAFVGMCSFHADCNHRGYHAWLISKANALGFSIEKKEILHTKNDTDSQTSQNTPLDLLGISNDLNSPKKSFKCLAVETLLSSSVSDDVNVKPRSCGKQIRTPYKLHLKSRKPLTQQQHSKLKSKLKGASIHASKKNSISSSQQVSSASRKKSSVFTASSIPNPNHSTGKECPKVTSSDSTSLINFFTEIDKYSFSPCIHDAILTVCKTTQTLVDEKWMILTDVERKNISNLHVHCNGDKANLGVRVMHL